MSRYVIYARKSTESDDRQVLSIESQVQELRSLATRQGVQVAEVLTESRSAKAPGRPVFGTLMKLIHRGDVRGVLAWKMDRLARNHFDTGQVLQALSDGLLERVITIDRTYTPDGNDRLIGNFELGMATKYIDDLRQNVKRGIRAKAQRGWISHTAPLGYLNDHPSKTIVKDPERFDLIRRMWDLVLTGTMRPTAVLQLASKEWGLRTRLQRRNGGVPLARSAFYTLLKNPFYMGIIRRASGETFVGAHPPMVTREEFYRVQELLGREARPRGHERTFSYTGLMRCGGCGAGITAEHHVKRSGREYVYYRCSRSKPGVVCRERPVALADLEGQIFRYLERLTIPDRIHDWLLTRARRRFEEEHGNREHLRLTLGTALKGVRREEETLLSLRLRDLLSDEQFMTKRQELEESRHDLERKIGKADQSLGEVREQLEATFTFTAKVSTVFRSGTAVQRRMILEAVGLNCTLTARKVALDFAKPFSIIADAAGRPNWCSTVDDVWNWLVDRTEYFRLPELQELPSNCSLPSDPRSGKGGGGL